MPKSETTSSTFDSRSPLPREQTDVGGFAAGVARDVRQRLLDDAIDDHLGIDRQAREAGRHPERDRDPASFVKSFDIGGQREAESALLEVRRMEHIGDGLQLGNRLPDQVLDLAQSRCRRLRGLGDGIGEQTRGDRFWAVVSWMSRAIRRRSSSWAWRSAPTRDRAILSAWRS